MDKRLEAKTTARKLDDCLEYNNYNSLSDLGTEIYDLLDQYLTPFQIAEIMKAVYLIITSRIGAKNCPA